MLNDQEEFMDKNAAKNQVLKERIEISESRIRAEFDEKQKYYHSESVIRLQDESKMIYNETYNKELIRGRYNLRMPPGKKGPNAPLILMANEEVAFQLYKNRDHVKKAPERSAA